MKTGQKINFKIWDDLFRDYIVGQGLLMLNVFGRLWRIDPDENPRLSGGQVQIHEDFIWKVV